MGRPLFHVFTLLLTVLAASQAFNTDSYGRVLQMSLQPRTADPVANENAKNSIIELVVIYYNLAIGAPYTIGSYTNLFGSGARRKRFAGFGSFGGGLGSSWGSSSFSDSWFDPWPSRSNTNNHHPSSSGSSSSHFHPSSGGYGGFNRQPPQILHCPVQRNQSDVYQLNPSPIGYPAADIGNELFVRSLPGSDLFFQCLLRAAVVPGQPPVVTVDQSFVTANATCRSQDLTLFNYVYQNPVFGGRCWIVQGFQESVLFSVCQSKSCTNCQPKRQTSSSRSNFNRYHPNTYNAHQPAQASTNVTANQCVTEYRTVQVIAYCENLPVNQRIIYDRIIIPLFCTCKSVDCMLAPQW